MKRTFKAIAFSAILLVLASCTLEDIIGIDFAGYDMSDPWGSWEKVKPGIYVGNEKGYNDGDLIAKGTDGSILSAKVGDEYDVPYKFKGYDADHTTYEFSYGESKGKKYLTCVINVLSDNQSSHPFYITTNVKAYKSIIASEGVSLMTTPKKYSKVASGGDILQNYKTICQKYQKLPYQAPKDQLIIDHTEYDVKWINSLYPSDMNSRGWVVPYSGKCESFTVNRQYGWESVGNRKILWGGCKWENVTWVIATVTDVDYAKALEYVNKVKATGKYDDVYEDMADGSGIVSFKATSKDPEANKEGYDGYIHPTYEITYTSALYNTMTIKFGVAYVTYV